MHRWTLRSASLIIVLGEDMRTRILEKGIPAEKIVIVRDGALSLPSVAEPKPDIVKAIRGEFPFVVVHAGNLGFAGAWETLLDAGGQLQAENVEIVMIGDGLPCARRQTR